MKIDPPIDQDQDQRYNHKPTPSLIRKRTRDLPNLYDCHSCGLHVSNFGDDRLRTLKSQWRIVLLCKKCMALVDSAELCSYCLIQTRETYDCFWCPNCSRRIHKECVFQSKCVPPWSYSFSGVVFSVCVDCWLPKMKSNSKGLCILSSINGKSSFVANSRVLESGSGVHNTDGVKLDILGASDSNVFSNRGINGQSCFVANSRVLENSNLGLKKNVGPVEKEATQNKTVVSKMAIELTSNVLEMVTCGGESVMNDSNLACQLHMAMNRSPRILKKPCLVNLDDLNAPLIGLLDFQSYRIPRKIEELIGSKLTENSAKVSDQTPAVKLHSVKIDGLIDVKASSPSNESRRHDSGERRCKNYVVRSDGFHNSIELEFCSFDNGGDFRDGFCTGNIRLNGQLKRTENFSSLEDEICRKPDWFLIKYSKRSPSLKATLHLCNKFLYEGFDFENLSSTLDCSNESCEPDRYLRKYSKRSPSMKASLPRQNTFLYEGFEFINQSSAHGMHLTCSNASIDFSQADAVPSEGLVTHREYCDGGVCVDNVNLAAQLHRSIHISPKFLRNICLINSTSLAVPVKRGCNIGNIPIGRSNTPSTFIYRKHEGFSGNKLPHSLGRIVSKFSDQSNVSDQDSVMACTSDSESEGKHESENVRKKVGLDGSCSNYLTASNDFHNSMEFESCFFDKDNGFGNELCSSNNTTLNCEIGKGKDFSGVRAEGFKPDRFLIKYSKRSPDMKAVLPLQYKYLHEDFDFENQPSAL